MKIEDIVCSLENAKKLKQLNIIRESLYYWWCCETELCECKEKVMLHSCQATNLTNYSAFTTDEFLSILKAHIRISKDIESDGMAVYFQPENGTDNSYNFAGHNLADLLAQVLIAQIGEGEFKND